MSCEWLDDATDIPYGGGPGRSVLYQTERRPATEELNGRLIVEFKRPGRQSYLNAERWADSLGKV